MENTYYSTATQICELLTKALAGNEDEKELAADLLNSAIKYTSIRCTWNLYSMDEKNDQDKYRTSVHNRTIDAINIFLRYESTLGASVPNLTDLDRKSYGDIANMIVALMAMEQR